MRLLAGCPPHFSLETRYGVRRESATCPTPLSRTCPQVATANADAPAEPSSPWAAPGQRKGGRQGDPLLTPPTNITRPAPGRIPSCLACEFCTLTPAHHLRGAAQNRELSAKVGQISAQSKAVAAPRLVHALVRRHSDDATHLESLAGHCHRVRLGARTPRRFHKLPRMPQVYRNGLLRTSRSVRHLRAGM